MHLAPKEMAFARHILRELRKQASPPHRLWLEAIAVGWGIELDAPIPVEVQRREKRAMDPHRRRRNVVRKQDGKTAEPERDAMPIERQTNL